MWQSDHRGGQEKAYIIDVWRPPQCMLCPDALHGSFVSHCPLAGHAGVARVHRSKQLASHLGVRS
eukprot:10613900-Alexandrium_andersonii.AAC.1